MIALMEGSHSTRTPISVAISFQDWRDEAVDSYPPFTAFGIFGLHSKEKSLESKSKIYKACPTPKSSIGGLGTLDPMTLPFPSNRATSATSNFLT